MLLDLQRTAAANISAYYTYLAEACVPANESYLTKYLKDSAYSEIENYISCAESQASYEYVTPTIFL